MTVKPHVFMCLQECSGVDCDCWCHEPEEQEAQWEEWFVVKHHGYLSGWQIWEGHEMPNVTSPEDDKFVLYTESKERAQQIVSDHNAARAGRQAIEALREIHWYLGGSSQGHAHTASKMAAQALALIDSELKQPEGGEQ